MAETIEIENDGATASVEEVVEYAKRHISARDYDSLLSAAPLMRRMSQDRHLINDRIERALIEMLDGRRTSFYTAQSFVLCSDGPILVRGNLWYSTGSRQDRRSPRDALFSYYMPHDHNYHFLTVGHFGPGYETEIFETAPDAHDGQIGTVVSLESEQRTALPAGKVMAYRAHRDIHTQLPPKSLSVSLNLMVRDRLSDTREQYVFDIHQDRRSATIASYPDASPVSVHASLVQLAATVGDPNVRQRLHDLTESDRVPPRVRRQALDALIESDDACREALLSKRHSLANSREWERRASG